MEHARGVGKRQRNDANKEWTPFSATGHRLGEDSGETLQSPDERRKNYRRTTNEMPEPASSSETLRSPGAWCNKCHCMHSPVRFRNAVTGKELYLAPHSILPCWLDPNTRSLEWYLKYVAYLLKLHISAIRFVATKVDGDSCVIKYKDQSFTLLTSLQNDSNENIWVTVMVDGTPTNQSES
jgi:hypothetical protein